MILSVDPGFANCGWAIVRPRVGRVIDLGVITTERDPAIDKSTDRARRVAVVIGELFALVNEYPAVTTIAAEQALGHGAAAAIAANLLPWGGLVSLSVVLGLTLLEVPAKQWQHAILPSCTKAIPYPQLEAQLSAFVAAQAADRLATIAGKKRTHALDAVGVGLFAALRSGVRRIHATPAIA